MERDVRRDLSVVKVYFRVFMHYTPKHHMLVFIISQGRSLSPRPVLRAQHPPLVSLSQGDSAPARMAEARRKSDCRTPISHLILLSGFQDGAADKGWCRPALARV